MGCRRPADLLRPTKSGRRFTVKPRPISPRSARRALSFKIIEIGSEEICGGVVDRAVGLGSLGWPPARFEWAQY